MLFLQLSDPLQELLRLKPERVVDHLVHIALGQGNLVAPFLSFREDEIDVVGQRGVSGQLDLGAIGEGDGLSGVPILRDPLVLEVARPLFGKAGVVGAVAGRPDDIGANGVVFQLREDLTFDLTGPVETRYSTGGEDEHQPDVVFVGVEVLFELGPVAHPLRNLRGILLGASLGLGNGQDGGKGDGGDHGWVLGRGYPTQTQTILSALRFTVQPMCSPKASYTEAGIQEPLIRTEGQNI